MRFQRRKVSGWTFTRAPRHQNLRARITRTSRVESWPGVVSPCAPETARAVCAGRGSRQPVRGETGKRARERRTRSHATKDRGLRLCVSSWRMEQDMNAQLYTLRDVTRLPTGGRAKFLGLQAWLRFRASIAAGYRDNPDRQNSVWQLARNDRLSEAKHPGRR